MGSSRVVLTSLLVLSLMAASGNSRKTWVMLLSGARGYYNYSLQSMVFHACHTLLNKGIPSSTIVHMNYDDIATDRHNPVQNNLVTVANGTVNWHPGCNVDYNKDEVTPDLFLKVLSGDKEGVGQLLGREGRVIESGPDDHIFLYMADHGGPGIFCFPDDNLHKNDLINTLKSMHEQKKYAKMMIYMEAGYSGSMFKDALPDNIELMATTAANDHEPAYACCYDKFRKAYVGGQFDNAWAYDTDKHDISKETFEDQYKVVWDACAVKTEHKSHPSQYGDKSFEKMVLGEFQGPPTSNQFQRSPAALDSVTMESTSVLDSIPRHLIHLPYTVSKSGLFYQDIDLVNPPFDMLEIATPARQLLDEENLEQRSILENRLDFLKKFQGQAEDFFQNLLIEAVGKNEAESMLAQSMPQKIEKPECYKSAVAMFQDSCPGLDMFQHAFLRRHLSRLIQLCNTMPSVGVMRSLEKAARLSSVCWAL